MTDKGDKLFKIVLIVGWFVIGIHTLLGGNISRTDYGCTWIMLMLTLSN